MAKIASIGIHPSYRSNNSDHLLKTEISRVRKITGKPITKSRQHYLKLTIPVTYKKLVNLDINEDYSMGYADYTGFRAGICCPYTFYNLLKEEEMPLTVFPFQVMDATLKEYMNLNPKEANEKIENLIKKVRKVNGTFISLWHNHSLSEIDGWEGWQEVYKNLVHKAK